MGIIWTLIIIVLILGCGGFLYVRHFLSLRPKENGFDFVLVKDDGTVWELDKKDQDYLQEEFHPADGARPYVKSRFNQLTPDGRIGGFIPRRRVPKQIKINK